MCPTDNTCPLGRASWSLTLTRSCSTSSALSLSASMSLYFLFPACIASSVSCLAFMSAALSSLLLELALCPSSATSLILACSWRWSSSTCMPSVSTSRVAAFCMAASLSAALRRMASSSLRHLRFSSSYLFSSSCFEQVV